MAKKRVTKKPKKFIVNPEWLDINRRAVKLELSHQQRDFAGEELHDYEEFFPQEKPYLRQGEIPDPIITKSWLLVLRPPCTQIVLPFACIVHGEMVDSEGIKFKGFPMKFWAVKTQFGILNLRMHECNMVDIGKYSGFFGTDYFMKYHSSKGVANKKFDDIMFYMKTKGISEGEAVKLLIGTENTNYLSHIYFVPHLEYQKIYCYNKEYHIEEIKKRSQIKEVI